MKKSVSLPVMARVTQDNHISRSTFFLEGDLVQIIAIQGSDCLVRDRKGQIWIVPACSVRPRYMSRRRWMRCIRSAKKNS